MYEEDKNAEISKEKSCYHRIQCTAVTFLAAFMWRRLLNNVVSTITVHGEPEKMPDGTCTQVKIWMINKCTIEIVEKEII